MALPRPLREEYGGSCEKNSASQYSHSVAKKARKMMPMTHPDHPVRGLQSTANACMRETITETVNRSYFVFQPSSLAKALSGKYREHATTYP